MFAEFINFDHNRAGDCALQSIERIVYIIPGCDEQDPVCSGQPTWNLSLRIRFRDQASTHRSRPSSFVKSAGCSTLSRRRQYSPSTTPNTKCALAVNKRNRPFSFSPKNDAYGVSSSIASTNTRRIARPARTRRVGCRSLAQRCLPPPRPKPPTRRWQPPPCSAESTLSRVSPR